MERTIRGALSKRLKYIFPEGKEWYLAKLRLYFTVSEKKYMQLYVHRMFMHVHPRREPSTSKPHKVTDTIILALLCAADAESMDFRVKF